jgi:hypothetical protein
MTPPAWGLDISTVDARHSTPEFRHISVASVSQVRTSPPEGDRYEYV